MCRAVLFQHGAVDEEAVVLAYTSLVFCALSVHVNKTEKRQHAVWVKDYLKKRETWMLQFLVNVRLSESQSDLVKLHVYGHRDV